MVGPMDVGLDDGNFVGRERCLRIPNHGDVVGDGRVIEGTIMQFVRVFTVL